MSLTLGDVIFKGFEIPSKIKELGGSQMLAKHKLIGGQRVTNAMGQDDSDPKWEGRFRGSDAEDRVQLLDSMRKSGQEFMLTFASFQYFVIIEDFKFDFMQSYEIPYSIQLYITRPTQLEDDTQDNLDGLVTDDTNSVSSNVSKVSSNKNTLETGMASLPSNVA